VSAQLSLGDHDQCTDEQLAEAGAPKAPSHAFP
jgi:hypothetical protein